MPIIQYLLIPCSKFTINAPKRFVKITKTAKIMTGVPVNIDFSIESTYTPNAHWMMCTLHKS